MPGLKRIAMAGPYSLLNAAIGTGGTSGRPVFVAGNGRSGTSWIGETLGRAENVLYYREPCQPRRNGLPPDRAEAVWCRYVAPGGSDRFFESTLDAAFRGHFWPGSGHRLGAYAERLGRRPRVVVKEVAAFMSVEWVAARWDPLVLIILRHPGAYAVSVRNLDQDDAELGRLRLLRADPVLQRDHVRRGLVGHLDAVRDPLEAAVASWAIRTSVVLDAVARHPDWIVVRYEDIARDPLAAFPDLYGRLGIAWTDAIADWVRGRTSTEVAGNYSRSRNSAARIDAWRDRLSAEETRRVRRVLEPFGLPIYAEAADWPG